MLALIKLFGRFSQDNQIKDRSKEGSVPAGLYLTEIIYPNTIYLMFKTKQTVFDARLADFYHTKPYYNVFIGVISVIGLAVFGALTKVLPLPWMTILSNNFSQVLKYILWMFCLLFLEAFVISPYLKCKLVGSVCRSRYKNQVV